MPKKHWATALKERNAELEAENKRLRGNKGGTTDSTFIMEVIARDTVEVEANTIANTLLNEICIKQNCRENVFIMEEGKGINAQPFRLTDSIYRVVSRQMLNSILEETKVDVIQWQSESYDCEDIARKFVTRCADLGINSIGRVMSWSGQHAFCIAIVQKGDGVEPVFIEPQTDQIITKMEGKYDLKNALIIIS